MKLLKNKINCSGCTACESICPTAAIQMKEDDEGFYYPMIDETKCINCNLCKKVCTFSEEYDIGKKANVSKVYAIKHKSSKERETSRSGGMFVALADYVLENSGVVYGVGFGENLKVQHKRIVKKEHLIDLKGSKYVQSDLRGTFLEILDDLLKNKVVLFTGTPCQTSGLKGFLSEKEVNIDKLIICDLICHGTPSPKIWRENIDLIEKKYNDRIVKADFRDKDFGWDSHIESYHLKDKNEKITQVHFTELFYKHFILRPACANCCYTNLNRPSDITLGDFWGIKNSNPDFHDDFGVSIVLINTVKGERIFEEITDKINYVDARIEDSMQPNLYKPSVEAPNRSKFWVDYYKNGYEYVLKSYTNYGFKYRSTNLFRRVVRKLKRIIIKVIKI